MTSPINTSSSSTGIMNSEEPRQSFSDMPSVHPPVWVTSKDELGGPLPKIIPDSNDVTYFSTHRALRLFYSQFIQHFANRLQIRALHALPTLFPSTHDSATADYLLVHQHRSGGRFRAANVYLKLVGNSNDGKDEWTVLILARDALWLPLGQWLTKLPTTEDPASAAEGYGLQCELCDAVGIRFLDLPAEIQRQITLHALGTHIVPLSRHIIPWHDAGPDSTLPQFYESLDHKIFITCGEHDV
ncbi:hypothetical protein AC579_8116 [Pseudocercospora musae]|uniref:Uncharacterized protein n=1 Tax=Pseudocercospora musae TaxID=113226 RepID=A0A139IG10_9PEZI|nr:hypothetical protein AC579_8116 [Pseudocercospora musae]